MAERELPRRGGGDRWAQLAQLDVTTVPGVELSVVGLHIDPASDADQLTCAYVAAELIEPVLGGKHEWAWGRAWRHLHTLPRTWLPPHTPATLLWTTLHRQ